MVAVVPLRRSVSVIADVGSGVVAVVPLRRPVSIIADVGSGVMAFDNRYWWLFYLASVFAWRRFGHLASVIVWRRFDHLASAIVWHRFGHLASAIASVSAHAIWPFGFGDCPISIYAVWLR